MTKNVLKIESGDILQNEKGDIAFVKGVVENGLVVYINGKKDFIFNNQFYHWAFANPIKDNRIVDSKTFAVRFKQFLDWIPKEFYMSGPHILEEYEYMKNVANQLLKYQIETAAKEEEINYLKQLNLYDNGK